jgi:chromosome segregation protein
MYLKLLEMRGFKTFADRTSMEFGQGITCIVGPNGSGKSNVTDAILWALGEQSNRNLRTESSQDVIFAGSQTRRPLGMAEVAVTIDNADNTLPTEYSDVTVSRRLFRSGDSEYLLNRTPGRLRDIRELFIDTGVGPNTYSVVSQGDIDRILSIRGEDRRELLEEVAGIRKYRVRRNEAERKLEATQANATRISDILHELKSQRTPLEREAETAREYLGLADSLRTLELQLFVCDHERRQQRIGRLVNEAEVTKTDLASTRTRISEIDAEYERASLDLAKLADETDHLRDQAGAAERTLDQAKQAAALREERSRALLARRDDLNAAILQAEARIGELEQQQASLAAERANLERDLADARDRIETLQEELAARRSQREDLSRQIRGHEERHAKLAKEATAHENQVAALQGLELDLQERTSRLSDQGEAMEMKRGELTAALEDTRTRSEQLKESLAQARAQLEEMRALRTQATQTLRDHRAKRSVLAGALAATESREALLLELENAHEGYAEGPRAVLNAAREGRLSGIRGTVGDLIDVSEKHELAIEAALGERLQWIVTETAEDAVAAVRYLEKTGAGRATFLPLSAVTSRAPQLSAGNITGPEVVGAALRLVRYPKDAARLVEVLLGDVIVVGDLDGALALSRRVATLVRRITTLNGEVVEPGGAIAGGVTDAASTRIFGRRRELEDVRAQLDTYRRALAEMWAREEQLEAETEAAAQHVTETDNLISELQTQSAQAQTSLKMLADQSRAAETAAGELGAEVAALAERMATTRSRREEAIEKAEGLRAEEAQVRAQIEALQSQLVPGEALDEINTQLTSQRVVAAHVDERLKSVAGLIQRTDADRGSAAAGIENSHRELKTIAQAEESIRAEAAAVTVETIQQLEGNATSLRAQVETNAAAVSDLREQTSQLDIARRRLEATAQEQTDRIHRTEIGLTREQAQLDAVIERLAEVYKLTPEQALQQRDPDLSESKVREQANALRSRIQRLGPVNVSAIDEVERLIARERFLDTQLDDLRKARQDLLDVIAEIDQAAEQEFLRTFEAVAKEFDVLFKRLFQGGETELRLTVPEAPLSSAIDVIVAPPGKRAQNLLLLSGGEKALTAISLLFAMLKVKPSPFCIMDEIDAALDAANTERFADILRDFSSTSQFIVITHNPRTMEVADVLYGVTMEQPGCSKLISVELSDAKKEAEREHKREEARRAREAAAAEDEQRLGVEGEEPPATDEEHENNGVFMDA